METARLHDAIVAAVGPVIVGVSVINPADKATWVIQYQDVATAQQRADAQAVLTAFNPKNVIAFADFISRWLNPEYKLLLQARANAVAAPSGTAGIPLIKQWDQAQAAGSVDLNTPAAVSFKAALVTANILTQVRADIIFS